MIDRVMATIRIDFGVITLSYSNNFPKIKWCAR